MYDPKMEKDIEHLWFILTGVLMCAVAGPLVAGLAAFFCVMARSFVRYKRGEWRF